MHRQRKIAVIVAILILSVIVAFCKKNGNAPVKGTTPIADLIAAGRPPVEMSSMFRGISPVAPTFTLTLTNVSDCPIKSVSGTVVFFDKDGRLLPESKSDTGYAELTAIKPGEKIELQTMTKDENALTGKWIIKQVIYLKTIRVANLETELPYKWTNPNYDAELAAASAK